MMWKFICALLLAGQLLFAGAAAAKSPKPPSVEQLIEHARDAVAAGTVDPARDLAPLIEALAAATKAEEAHDLMNAIGDFGDYDRTRTTAAVKNYLRDVAPPVLFKVAQNQMDIWTRDQAYSLLKKLNVSDGVLDQAIAIAQADHESDAKAQHIVQNRIQIMQQWKTGLPTPFTLAPADPEKERIALARLHAAGDIVSASALGQAARHGRPATIDALVDAGVPINSPLLGSVNVLVDVATGCLENHPDTAALIRTIDTLVKHGIDPNPVGRSGNGILFEAARDCPRDVVQKLIDVGVKVERSPSGFSPLEAAFVSGKWDVAQLLIEHGARLTKKQVSSVFFEKPTDPAQLAIINKALSK